MKINESNRQTKIESDIITTPIVETKMQ